MNRKYSVLIALLLPLAFVACTAGNIEALPAPVLLTPISARFDTAAVTRGPVASVSRHTGIVRVESVGLGFGASAASFGEFFVRVGDFVEEGQLLAVPDTARLETQVANQTDLLARLRRNHSLENDLRAIDIDIMNLQNHHGTEAAIIELGLTRERQALTIRHEEERLDELTARLRESRIYAPFDGVVTLLVEMSWVPSFTPVIYIAPAGAPVFVEYFGEETLTPRTVARIRGSIDGRNYELTHIPLTREQILHYRNMGVRFPVRFDTGTEHPLPVGSLVSIYLYTVFDADVLRIPRGALLSDPDLGHYAYRIEGGASVQVFIDIGAVTETYVSVLSGLSEGDVVYVRP